MNNATNHQNAENAQNPGSAASPSEAVRAEARRVLATLYPEASGSMALAHPNIALVKYWGKRDSALNLPAVSSLSLTLDTLYSVTQVERNIDAVDDQFVLDGHALGIEKTQHMSQLVERFRTLGQVRDRVLVHSHNNFPTAAGLASSASGYAALVTALNHAFATQLSKTELSALARIGSGSAARSVFGGFAIMEKGANVDGSDAVAFELAGPQHWPLEVVVAITSEEIKTVSSTVGMETTRDTSAFWPAWVDTQHQDMCDAQSAVETKDFDRLAEVTERSCLKMHGLMLSSGLLYWNPATLECIHVLRDMRSKGVGVCYTIDAGPQVKAICAPGQADAVVEQLATLPGVLKVVRTGLGSGASVLLP